MGNVGFIGWRGMVGSVLMERMRMENDFVGFDPLFFSTSQAGHTAPEIGRDAEPVIDAYDFKRLKALDIIVSCQGGGYTEKCYPELRKGGWNGYWIDAASTLRMDGDSIIVLDPVNRNVIDDGLSSGIKNYIGGNCTVSLMLMALGGLFEKGYRRAQPVRLYSGPSDDDNGPESLLFPDRHHLYQPSLRRRAF